MALICWCRKKTAGTCKKPNTKLPDQTGKILFFNKQLLTLLAIRAVVKISAFLQKFPTFEIVYFNTFLGEKQINNETLYTF